MPDTPQSALADARVAVKLARQLYEEEANTIERIDDQWRADAALEKLKAAEARLQELIEPAKGAA